VLAITVERPYMVLTTAPGTALRFTVAEARKLYESLHAATNEYPGDRAQQFCFVTVFLGSYE
jgi:hypothetical protein